MRHKCENWIQYNKNTLRCFKCYREYDTLKERNPFKVGDVVKPKRGYTYSGRKFRIKKTVKAGYMLTFLGGSEKGTDLEAYAWWELQKYA